MELHLLLNLNLTRCIRGERKNILLKDGIREGIAFGRLVKLTSPED